MRLIALLLLLHVALFAKLNIAVSYPYIGAITKAIGANQVETVVLAKGNWDPHFVVPRPSLIAKMRSADALIMNGAQLEIGWLPPLIRRANNPKTNPSSPTLLNLSHYMTLIDKPKSVDRSGGDIHPDGNPHFHLDPENILKLAAVVRDFLSRIDIENRSVYEANYQTFAQSWAQNIKRWDAQMADKKALKVIQFHDNLAYFNHRYGLHNIGTIEPLPGIPPSSRHTIELIKLINAEHPCCILHDVYHSTRTAEFIASKTGIDVVVMPHDIGALESINDLRDLFDYLCGAIK